MLVVRLILILPKWLFFISSLVTITIAIKTRTSAPFSRKSTHFFSCLIFHAMKSQFWFQVAFHTHHIAYFVHLLCVFFFSLAFPSYILLSGCYFTRILEINQRNSRHDALVLMPFRCYCNEYKTSSAVAAVPPLQWSGKKGKNYQSFFCFYVRSIHANFPFDIFLWMTVARYTNTRLINIMQNHHSAQTNKWRAKNLSMCIYAHLLCCFTNFVYFG